MAASSKKALVGNIHRIREFELEKVCLVEEFDILQIVGEGWFGKILLVEHRGTDTEMVLKALPKPYVSLRDFYREFHYGLHLGAHKNIITTYDVAFETAGFYVFSQEYAPLGDLTSNVSDTGIGELHTKRVAKQLGAALDHVHARDLVHRDVKLDNILVFKSDFSRIKLCDFGETRKSGTEIRRRNEWLPYSPPEILQTPVEGVYKSATSHDVWQYGIVIFVCLTGCLPWQKAALDDPRYVRYLNWYNSSNPLRKIPKLFKLVSSRAQKMFKKFLEPRFDKRPPGLGDLHKYIDDRWTAKGINEKNGTDGVEVDELCPSMYSFHSDINEKNKLLNVLLQHGVETTVDRVAKKARIKDWIQNSVITEEDENDNDDSNCSNSPCPSDDEEEDEPRISIGRHPIEKNHQRWSSMRYNNEKHINPRTGKVYDKGKTTNENIQAVSYDMQQVQPITPSDIAVKYVINKDESPSHGSTKDSAYGSLDFKTSPAHNSNYSNTPHNNIANGQYPSQKLQQDLQQQNMAHTPMNAAQIQFYNHNKNQQSTFQLYKNGSNISSSKSSPFSSSAELKNSQPTLLKSASTSTTTLTRSSPQQQSPHKNNKPSSFHQQTSNKNNSSNSLHQQSSNKTNNSNPLQQKFTPMKDSPYDKQKPLYVEPERQQDTTFVVQGQMKINPYGPNKMISPRMQKYATFNGKQNSSRENVEEEENDEDALKKLRQMLLESKTGLND